MRFGFRELLFLLVMVGLLGCTYLFVFEKANAKRASLRSDMERKLTELADLRQTTAGITDMNRKIAEIQKAIAFFESKLPQEKEMDKILTEVSQLVETNSLQIKTVRTMKIEKAAGYSELPITLSLHGDFKGFYAFLLQLEKLPRITRITQMNLQKINDREGEMQATLTLSIFFEPDGGSPIATTN